MVVHWICFRLLDSSFSNYPLFTFFFFVTSFLVHSIWIGNSVSISLSTLLLFFHDCISVSLSANEYSFDTFFCSTHDNSIWLIIIFQVIAKNPSQQAISDALSLRNLFIEPFKLWNVNVCLCCSYLIIVHTIFLSQLFYHFSSVNWFWLVLCLSIGQFLVGLRTFFFSWTPAIPSVIVKVFTFFVPLNLFMQKKDFQWLRGDENISILHQL